MIAELAIREFFLPSNTDIEQLAVICDVFGTPTEDVWPGVSKLRFYNPPNAANAAGALKKAQPLSWWRARFPLLGEDGIDLVRGMLTLNPQKRLTAKQALEHRYWTNAPKPTRLEDLPRNRAGGETKMAEDLKRRGGEIEADGGGSGRAEKVARRLDFGSMVKR